MVQVTCKCGTVFEARQADINRGWGKSCSKSCAKTTRPTKRRSVVRRAFADDVCRECGGDWPGADGLCDHCAFMNEPLMGWDEHKC